MHIILITIAYPPEIRTISSMMRELAEALAAHGHVVTVLTPWPQYNLSDDAKARSYETVSEERGVRVIRIKTLPQHHVPYLLRGIAELTLPFFFLRAFRRFVRTPPNTVIVYSPHLPLTIVGTKIKKKYGARYLLNIQDIFPQNAIDLGLLKNKLLIRFFERMERNAYRNADAITTHTQGGRRFLIEHKGVPQGKVSVVPDWIHVDLYRNAKKTGIFRARYGGEGKCIFLFPGVFGPTQRLDFLLDIAKATGDIPELLFLLVGEGTEKKHLQERVRRENITNVRFVPFVDPNEYPQLLKDVDVGVLCLGKDTRTPAVPGKLFGFMASGLPVVGFVNKESDAMRIIGEAQCGVTMIADDVGKAARCIRKLYRDKEQRCAYGENGYQYAMHHFSKESCIQQLERLIV